jgi:hypothetical protein
MAVDVPNAYLERIIKLLTGARGLGSAVQIREGFQPYSREIDFRTTDVGQAQGVVTWASNQAPYADVQLVPQSTTGVTVYAHVVPDRLAHYLAERAYLQVTGQSFLTAPGALPTLVERVVAETIAVNGSWASIVSRLHVEQATLTLFLRLLEADAQAGGIAAVIQEAIAALGLGDCRDRLVERLQAMLGALQRMTLAVETGEYLEPTRSRRAAKP